jgi:Tfp pilus assembly protein PilZ
MPDTQRPEDRPPSQPAILTLSVQDKRALAQAWMPFIRNGGLFIPTATRYHLGDEVFLMLNLFGGAQRIATAAKVVWINPPAAQGKRPQGIGVQLSTQDGGQAYKQIASLLAGVEEPDGPPQTL